MKWSPHRLAKAKKAGVEPLRALRVIRKRGRWCSAPTVGPGQPKSGKRAAAPYVGLLCVCMGAYCLKLYEGSSRRHSHRIKGRIQLRASGPARAAARALPLVVRLLQATPAAVRVPPLPPLACRGTRRAIRMTRTRPILSRSEP